MKTRLTLISHALCPYVQRAAIVLIEAVLGTGPFFGGARFSIVDAVFGPVFRYFDVLDAMDDFAFFRDLPKVTAWRARLAARESVRRAVRPEYPSLLTAFLRDRGSELSRRMAMQDPQPGSLTRQS